MLINVYLNMNLNWMLKFGGLFWNRKYFFILCMFNLMLILFKIFFNWIGKIKINFLNFDKFIKKVFFGLRFY